MQEQPSFHSDFIKSVQAITGNKTLIREGEFDIFCINSMIFVHLIPLFNGFNPTDLIRLQQSHSQNKQTLIHLWEDVWWSRKPQVIARLTSLCKLNQTIYGRKTKLVDIDRITTKDFLNKNHLQGYASAKYQFGLTYQEELVAVASFASPRLLSSKGENYYSAELVRFASKMGVNVVGALSKLIGYFKKQQAINDLMTYADCDWSSGQSYQELNFQFGQRTTALCFYTEIKSMRRYTFNQLPKAIKEIYQQKNPNDSVDFLLQNDYVRVFNTGNLKYYLLNE